MLTTTHRRVALLILTAALLLSADALAVDDAIRCRTGLVEAPPTFAVVTPMVLMRALGLGLGVGLLCGLPTLIAALVWRQLPAQVFARLGAEARSILAALFWMSWFIVSWQAARLLGWTNSPEPRLMAIMASIPSVLFWMCWSHVHNPLEPQVSVHVQRMAFGGGLGLTILFALVMSWGLPTPDHGASWPTRVLLMPTVGASVAYMILWGLHTFGAKRTLQIALSKLSTAQRSQASRERAPL